MNTDGSGYSGKISRDNLIDYLDKKYIRQFILNLCIYMDP